VADLEPRIAALEADVAALDAASRSLAARAGMPPDSPAPVRRPGGGALALLRRWV